MFTQLLIFLTATLYFQPIRANLKPIYEEGQSRNCKNFLCPVGAFDKSNRADYQALKKLGENDINDDDIDEVCMACDDCTNNGYSVCAQYRESYLKLRAIRAVDHSNNCACASSVPDGCTEANGDEERDPSMENVQICYLKSILIPPKPMAVNTKEKDSKKKIVVATLEAFWLDPYWAQFNLSDLNLIYEFSLTTPEYCEGELKTIEKAGLPEHTCRASLKIEMNGTDDTLAPDSVRDDPSNEKISNEEEYDDGLGPEVQFDKDVFADAKNVRMFYTVKVHSPRQLNLAKNENPIFEDVDTMLTSETLNFSLKDEDELDDEHDHKNDDDPDSYEYPEPASEGHKKVSNVNTEDKNSADRHAGHEKSKEHGKGVASDGKQHEPEDSKNKEEDKEENDSTEKSQEETKDDENEEKSKENDEKSKENDEKSKENEDDHEEETKPDIIETQEKPDSEETLETSLLESNGTEGNSTEVNTSSFFDEYLNNAGQWPLLKIGLIVTILSCTLLFLLGCCCYHKDCCCYSDRKKVTSKSANGYQYHMTNGNGNGQEMTPLTKAVQNGLKESANSTLQRSKSEENPLDILEKALISPLEDNEPTGAEIHGEITKLLIPDDSSEAHQFRDLLETAPQLWPRRLRIDAAVGTGHFGVINRGLLIDSENGLATEVTISNVKKLNNLNDKETKALMIVLSDAVKAQTHPNIISLLAVQQQPDRLLVVTDSMFYPDLLSLLRESRLIKYDGRLQKRTASMLSAERLIGMMNDTVSGAGHLIRNGISHPMLAASNVLVTGGVLKISGFGFATHRHLHSRQFEARPTKQRWQPPEFFLSDLVPIQPGQSMIWSLGVLLWEIVSLGGTPYANIPTPEAFSARIREQTAKLTMPSYISQEIVSIIEMCCCYDKQKRPDMTDVISRKLELIAITPDIHIDLTFEQDEFPYLPILTGLEHIVAQI
uniref:Protein kinase domain-containing protein n=1 Tax=Acrobeloides nanus TaxID=290746 RepID=A0A914E4C5_9BILA